MAKSVNKDLMKSQSIGWCLTWNNYPDECDQIIRDWKDKEESRYALYSREIGSGTPHLQMYIRYSGRVSFKTVRKDWNLEYKCHIEPARGSFDSQLKYISKETTPVELGERPNPGKRTDLMALKGSIDSGASCQKIREEYYGYWLSHKRTIIADILHVKSKKRKEDRKWEDTVLRPWQKKIADIVASPVHDREVHWVVDNEGNSGKTTLVNYLEAKYPEEVMAIQNGKKADIAHIYNGEGIILIDMARCTKDLVNYDCIESLKNGRIMSGKYESCMKVFAIPHVIIMANYSPDYGMLSKDRWVIHMLEEMSGIWKMDTSRIDKDGNVKFDDE
jgi:hypothetical protein